MKLVLIYFFVLLFVSGKSFAGSVDQIEESCVLKTNNEIVKKSGIQKLKTINQSIKSKYLYLVMNEICIIRELNANILASPRELCLSNMSLSDCFLSKTRGRFRTISSLPLLLASQLSLTKKDQISQKSSEVNRIKLKMIEQMVVMIEEMAAQKMYSNTLHASNSQQDFELNYVMTIERNVLNDSLIKYGQMLYGHLNQLELNFKGRGIASHSEEITRIKNLKVRVNALRDKKDNKS